MVLEKHFPKTLKLLGPRAQDIRQLYIDEMGFSEGDIESGEDLRYFAGFIRQNFRDEARLIEVAQWESIQLLLRDQDLSYRVNADAGTVILNPSYQVVILNSANPELARDQGLYIFVRNFSGKVIEHRLDSFEALLIDLVTEDRKYTPDQLLATIDEEREVPLPSTEERQKKFKSLIDADILRVV